MSRVTLTINLELDTPNLPSNEALHAAMERAQNAAARECPKCKRIYDAVLAQDDDQ